MKCPKCGYKYQVPEDEVTCSIHPCPNCGEDGRRWYLVTVAIHVETKASSPKEAREQVVEDILNGDLQGEFRVIVEGVEEL